MKGGCFFMSYNIELLLVIRQQQITFALFLAKNGIGRSGSRLRKPSLWGGFSFITISLTNRNNRHSPNSCYHVQIISLHVQMKWIGKEFPCHKSIRQSLQSTKRSCTSIPAHTKRSKYLHLVTSTKGIYRTPIH